VASELEKDNQRENINPSKITNPDYEDDVKG